MGRQSYRPRTALRPDITARVPYVDSVFLRMPSRMEKERFADLKRNLEHAQGTGRRRGTVRLDVIEGGKSGRKWFFLVLSVHQPTRRAIELLAEDGRGTFYGLHIALDLAVATAWDAVYLQEYLVHHLHKNKTPANPSHRNGSVTHIGQGMADYVDGQNGEIVKGLVRRGSSIVVYSDKLSKVILAPCVHVEYRMAGKRHLEREEFYGLGDILDLDHIQFWEDRLLLLKPPTTATMVEATAEAMGRQAVRAGGPARDWETRLREAEKALGRAFGPHSIDYRKANGVDIAHVLQKTKLTGEKTTPFRLFTDMSADWMLPTSRGNAFWCADRSRLRRLESSDGGVLVARGSRVPARRSR